MSKRFLSVVLFLALTDCSSAALPTTSGSSSSSGGDRSPEEGGGPSSGQGGRGATGAPLPMTQAVSIQVQPSDAGAALLNAIKGAKKSVHMTMYLLTSTQMIGALTTLKQAGKEVKVILNKTFPNSEGSNDSAFTTLKNKGVDVVWASSGYTFTHAKTIVIDGSKAIVGTMNLTYSSPTTNREYLATVTDSDDVAVLEQIFDADFLGHSVSLPSKLVLSPASANSLRSPRAQLTWLIDSAKSSLDVEVQSLSDDGLVAAIVAAHKAKIDVKVVLDPQTLNSPAQKDALAELKAAGVSVRGLKTPDIHAKSIVADGARFFVGSHNFTTTALDSNREVGILSDQASEAKKVSEAIRGDFASGSAL